MSEHDTIVAIGSAHGPGARGVVRLSGSAAFRILESLGCDAGLRAGGATAPIARVVRLTLADWPPLPALAAISFGPRSYTGEDTVEVLAAGSPIVLEAIERAAIEAGARRAEPGEFTSRAFLNGRLTLDRAEGVGMLIGACSLEEWKAGRRLLRGEEGARAAAMTERVARLLALVEAGIDFTDQEDVVPISRDALRAALRDCAAALDNIAASESGEARSGAVRIVLTGPPNAGKSTLFNALLGWTRAIVSDLAHTTRDALVEPFDLGGEARLLSVEATIADIAGVDDLADRTSLAVALAQRAAADALTSADVVMHCDPAGLFPELVGVAGEVIRVVTKADLGDPRAADDPTAHRVCAIDGWNLDGLRRAMVDAALRARGGAGAESRLLSRHREAYRDAALALRLAERDAAPGEGPGLASPELVALSLREALDALGRVTGAVHADDVIGLVFATFCVGK